MFSLFLFNYRIQRASAVLPFVVAGGAVVSYEALTVLAAATVIAGGAVANIDQNSKDIQALADGLIATGHSAEYLATKVSDTGQQFLTWTQEGLNWFNYQVPTLTNHQNIVSGGGYSCPYDSTNTSADKITVIGSFTLPAGGTFRLEGVDGSTPYSYSVTKATSISYQIRARQNFLNPPYVEVFRVDWGSGVWTHNFTNVNDTDFTTTIGLSIGLSSLATTYNPTVATDVWGGSNPSNTQSVDDYGYGVPIAKPVDSDVLSTDMAIPYGQSWGDISADLGITYPTGDTTVPGDTTIPGDTTSNPDTTGTIGEGILNIPILGDILKALRDILAFLGTLIASLVTALMSALKDLLTELFVPSDDFFINNFQNFSQQIGDKFHLDTSTFDKFKNASEKSPLGDIHFTIMGVAVVLSVSFVEKIVPIARSVAMGGVAIGLAYYNYRKIIWIIRGSAPVGGTGASTMIPSPIYTDARGDVQSARRL